MVIFADRGGGGGAADDPLDDAFPPCDGVVLLVKTEGSSRNAAKAKKKNMRPTHATVGTQHLHLLNLLSRGGLYIPYLTQQPTM